jgi:uncharacterized protein
LRDSGFPKLQFVIGPMGEGLPFFFQRLDIMPMAVTKLNRSILSYLKENVHYTFSGMNFPPTFLDLLLELGGVDRIMFSADYPYQSMPWARAFLEQIPVSAADRSASPMAMQSGFFSSNDALEFASPPPSNREGL